MEIADCYRLLGLRTGASHEDIKASYRRLARIYHPDANPTNQQQAKEKFIQLTEAYRKLSSIIPPTSPNRAKDKSATPAPEVTRDRSPAQSGTNRPSAPSRSAPSRSSPSQPSQAARSSQSRSSQSQPAPSQVNPPRKTPSVRRTPDLTSSDLQLKQKSYEQLQQLLRDHRFPRAIALVEGLSQRLPNDLEIRQWQAITYQRFGRYLIKINQPEKAKPYLRKALRTDPHNKSLGYEVDRDFRRIQEMVATRRTDRLPP